MASDMVRSVQELMAFLIESVFEHYGETRQRHCARQHHAYHRLLTALAEQLGDLNGFRKASPYGGSEEHEKWMFPKSFHMQLSRCGYNCIAPEAVNITHVGMAVQCINIKKHTSRWSWFGRHRLALLEKFRFWHPQLSILLAAVRRGSGYHCDRNKRKCC